MNPDYTQQQSLVGLEKAEKLSLRATLPPAEIAGYRIEKLLGQGAYGQVWLGHDLNTGRQVAIKFYLYRGGVNWSLLDREVKHLVNMSTGRHIVQVLGVGWESEPPYYVMEYLESGSLEDMLRARGSLSVPKAVTMLREIAEGLSFAHSKGVLHCDLKPANVLLDHDWRPRLADFGQSRMSTEQTPSLGTLFYMAPEQADLTASPDAAWDVYALGAIAYCMLVGSPPYRSPEVIETLDTANSLPERLSRYRETIRSARKPRLHYRRRGIDKGLCQIIDRCLAVKLENRFANVQQVIAAIDSRNVARTRRPLYLMGIVGPILFLLLMFFFSSRSIGVARQQSLDSIQQGTVERNQFASQLAAGRLESEFEALFRLVEDESKRAELRNLVLSTEQSAAPLLQTIADGGEHPQEREAFKGLSEQHQLSDYISARLKAMITKEGDGSGAAIFNSIFVNDAHGSNLAIGFADPEELLSSSPVGRNFAYRSYFNGLRDDAWPSRPRSEFAPTRVTHLSATFQSTSTGKWKLGISTPIWGDDAMGETGESSSSTGSIPSGQSPIAVLVLTINLGDFELLSRDAVNEAAAIGQNQFFAGLVDGRAGNGQGTLLQHPFLRKLERNPDIQKNSVVPRIDERLLSRLQAQGGIIDYIDPASKFDEGHEFEGPWIAAIQQVRLPRSRTLSAGERSKSDLWVLVQERRSTVEAPVARLLSRLQRESYFALGVILLVMLGLWYFVIRINRSAADTQNFTGQNPPTNSSVQTTLSSPS